MHQAAAAQAAGGPDPLPAVAGPAARRLGPETCPHLFPAGFRKTTLVSETVAQAGLIGVINHVK